MSFRSLFSRIFGERRENTADRRFEAPVAPAEPLARFLLSSSQFSKKNQRVKFQAFMPPADLRLSVFRIVELSEAEVWRLGEQHVARAAGKTLHARADLAASAFTGQKLSIDADNAPVRHANVLGWATERSEQQLVAMELARLASLRVNPPDQA